MKTTANLKEDLFELETNETPSDNLSEEDFSSPQSSPVSVTQKVTVSIMGQNITLTTDEDPNEVLKAAAFLNDHIEEVKRAGRTVSTSDMLLRVAFVLSAKALKSTEELESIERRSAEKLRLIEELLEERIG